MRRDSVARHAIVDRPSTVRRHIPIVPKLLRPIAVGMALAIMAQAPAWGGPISPLFLLKIAKNFFLRRFTADDAPNFLE